jgi:pimeloyl-ACP methyl ester carboxylesterase
MHRIKKILFTLLIAGALSLLALYLIMHSRQETDELTDAVRSEAPGKFIRLRHGLVHYSIQGPDTSRLLLFIHGGGVTGMEVWRHNIPYFLNQGYRILSYDLYGRGYSDRPADVVTPELLADQLNELIDTLGIRQRLDIVTMSMGAIVTLDFAAKHPEQVDKIVMLDPAATGDFVPMWSIRYPVLSDFVMTVYWHPLAVEKQRKEFVNRPLFEVYAQRLRYFMKFRGYKKVSHATWMTILTQNRLALVKQLHPNKLLIIYGDHDPYFPNIPQYQEVYPTLKSVLISETGHMPHYEKPEEVNPIIAEFLKK